MEAATLPPSRHPAAAGRSPILTSVPLLPQHDVAWTLIWRSRRRRRASPNRLGSFRRQPERLRARFRKSQQRLAFRLRADEAPQMHSAIADDGDVAAAEIGPRWLLRPGHQLEADLA